MTDRVLGTCGVCGGEATRNRPPTLSRRGFLRAFGITATTSPDNRP